MKNFANLKGYTKAQRNLAYEIRAGVIITLDLSVPQQNRLYDRLMAITSPMFFIKYREKLEGGKIALALSYYQDENFNRRASFAMKGKKDS